MKKTRKFDIRPFRSEDAERVVATAISREHAALSRMPHSEHHGYRPKNCPECRSLRVLVLVVLAAKAREMGYTRELAIKLMINGTNNSDGRILKAGAYASTACNWAVSDAQRTRRGLYGLLERPREAANGAHYEKAFVLGLEAGILRLDIATAQRVLGYIIEAVQDLYVPPEPGHLIPVSAVARRLQDSGVPDLIAVADLGVAVVWAKQIEPSILLHKPAINLADKHIYRHLLHAGRLSAAVERNEDGSVRYLVDAAANQKSVTAVASGSGSDTESESVSRIDKAISDLADELAALDRVPKGTKLRERAKRVYRANYAPEGSGTPTDAKVIGKIMSGAKALMSARGRPDHPVAIVSSVAAALSPEASFADARRAVAFRVQHANAGKRFDLTSKEGIEHFDRWINRMAHDALAVRRQLASGVRRGEGSK